MPSVGMIALCAASARNLRPFERFVVPPNRSPAGPSGASPHGEIRESDHDAAPSQEPEAWEQAALTTQVQ